MFFVIIITYFKNMLFYSFVASIIWYLSNLLGITSMHLFEPCDCFLHILVLHVHMYFFWYYRVFILLTVILYNHVLFNYTKVIDNCNHCTLLFLIICAL